jgi:hypothetical protein
MSAADTPSAAELAETVRALLGNYSRAKHDEAQKTLARYDAAQKSPLDALLAWAPGPWIEADGGVATASDDELCVACVRVEMAGYAPALLRLLAAAPQMLDALREYNRCAKLVFDQCDDRVDDGAFPESRHVWRAVIDALAAAGDKP